MNLQDKNSISQGPGSLERKPDTTSRPKLIPFIVFVLGVMSLVMILFVVRIFEQNRSFFLYTDIAHELQIEISKARIWLEEYGRGTIRLRGEKDCWECIETSVRLAETLLQGGATSHGKFVGPLDDPGQRKLVAEIRDLLAEYQELARRRYRLGLTHPRDDRLETVFSMVLEKAFQFDEMIEEDQELNEARGKRLFSGILATWSLAILAVAFGLRRYELSRQRDEEAIIASRREWLRTFDAVPDLMMIIDSQYRVRRVNRALAAKFGCRPADLIGKQCHELMHPGTMRLGNCPHAFMLQDGTAHEAEYFDERDGKHYQITVSPIFDASGAIEAAVHVSRDITMQKKSAELLHVKDTAIATSLNAIAIGDLTGRITYVNRSLLDMWGYHTEDELLGQPASILAHDPSVAGAIIADVMKDGRWVGERLAVRKDGTTFPAEVSAHLVKHGQDRPLCLMASFFDVTERKRNEGLLQAMLGLYQVSTSRSLDEIIQEGLDHAVALTGSSIGFFHFVDEAAQAISLQSWSSSTLSQCTVGEKSEHYPVSSAGIWADSIRKRAPLVVNDYCPAPSGGGLPEGHVALTRFMSVPIFEGGRVIAVIGAGNRSRPYQDEDVTSLTLIANTIRTLIRQKQAEELLRESEERFRSIVQSSPMGIFSFALDKEGAFVVAGANPAADAILGIDCAQLIGKKLEEAFPSTVPTGLVERYREVLTGGIDWQTGDFVYEDANVRGLFEISAFKTGERTVTAMFRDVTERKKAEQELAEYRQGLEKLVRERTAELRQNEAMYRRLSKEFNVILDAMPDALLLFGLDHRVVWANHSAIETLGKGGDTLMKRRCSEVWHGREALCEACPLERSFQSGHPESTQVTTPDGRLWAIRAYPITDEEGLVSSVMQLATDITEKVTMQAEHMRAMHLASLGELAAGVAHEINNPVNGIINYAQILSGMTGQNEEGREISSRIIREGGRIANIVRSLLSFARDRKEDKIPSRIETILDDTLALTETQLRKNGILLSVDIPPELPLVLVNVQQMQQVFLNIINNARYALNERYPGPDKDKRLMISGGAVRTDDGQFVRVTFRDHGTGIPARVVDRVMNPFFTTKPAGVGTGLGLSISHGIITDHEGKMRIESAEQSHTTVTIDLPVFGGGS